jgi:hypothetical protein
MLLLQKLGVLVNVADDNHVAAYVASSYVFFALNFVSVCITIIT